MREKRKSICIIAFSPIARDARVLRQIQYLSPHYDVTVIGQGEAHSSWKDMSGVRWLPTLQIKPERSPRRLMEKGVGLFSLLAGRVHPDSFNRWYWRQPIMKDTLAKALASDCDAFHANDWNTLPIAVEAAKKLKARVLFDAHEFGPLEFENRAAWRIPYSPMITYMLRKYGPKADVSITVAPAIAARLQREFQMDTSVILNTPAASIARARDAETNFADVRLIHHGGAIRDRRLEVMIAALAQCHRRFSLHLMLVPVDTTYIAYLKNLAEELTPGRVFFHDPVAPEEVVERISGYDVGLCYIAPTNYNYLVSLPNKFFDFIAGGLPVCIGPSPSMAEIVNSYNLGCVAASFEPEDMAAALNQLTPEQLAAMRRGARVAAREINADREMGKLVEIYKRLLAEEQ